MGIINYILIGVLGTLLVLNWNKIFPKNEQTEAAKRGLFGFVTWILFNPAFWLFLVIMIVGLSLK